MRIVVVSVPAQSQGVPEYVQVLAKGMAAMGHQVDILDAWTQDGGRLPAYDYIAVSVEAVSWFGGKLPEPLTKVLAVGDRLMGKKGAAFLKKTGPFTTKALSNLMRMMEKEGMMVNWSEVILSAPQAESLGKRIGA
ncbi:MAG: hypothetical protein LBD74_06905 [Spirochaetaceae bacterium]|jgi:hypothetical protein|nr:hypothetical protein [Spirochaetaceae bacterium]